MTAWEGLNRRKFPRVNFPCLVIVQHDQSAQDTILTHTENIGIGGGCVALKMNKKMFAPENLELDLLDGDNPIKCKGKVVWSIRRKSHETIKPSFHDVGIEFSNIQPADQKRIEAALHSVIRKGYKILKE